MNESRKSQMSQAEALAAMERAMLQGVDMFLPSLGDEVATYLPVVKKGIAYIVKLLRDVGTKDAEKILDRLLRDRMEKL